MKSILYKLTAVLFAIMLIPQMAFASDGSQWIKIKDYESRQNFLIDKGEVCLYIIQLYQFLTDKDLEPVKNIFSDVDENSQSHILQAYSLGLIEGIGNNLFGSENSVTRAELSGVLYKLVKIIYPQVDLSGGENIWFPDQVEDSDYKALRFAFTRGIIAKQSNGIIAPYEKLTLGDTIRMMDKIIKSAPKFEIIVPSYNMKKAYLTFDDGTSKNTIPILDTLKKYDVKASFFITGYADQALVEKIITEGHVIGNHTYSHDYSKIYLNSEAFWKDFKKEEQYLENILGYKPLFIRFPGGSNNTVSLKYGNQNVMKTITSQAAKEGYIYFDWNVSSGDATSIKLTKDEIVNNVLTQSKSKNDVVILMHQTADKTATVQALPEIIEGLHKMGFTLLPLDETSPTLQFLKPE